MRVDVRPLEADEWMLWRRLRLEALADAPHAFGRTHAEESVRPDVAWRDAVREQSQDPDVTYLVAEVDDAAVGIAICRMDAVDPSLAHVFSMWVRPEARRAGAATLLLDEAADWATRHGATTLELAVTEGNAAALALYRAAGFAATGRREPLRRDSAIHVVYMRRRLA